MEGTFINVDGKMISMDVIIARRKEAEQSIEEKVDEIADEKELSRDEIKAVLKEKGITFKGNASTESLKQLIK